MFWAGFPHQITYIEEASFWSVSLPLAVVLKWALPQRTFVHPLLRGKLLVETQDAAYGGDLAMVSRWKKDLVGGDPDRHELVLLELHGRLRRLSLEAQAGRHVWNRSPRQTKSPK